MLTSFIVGLFLFTLTSCYKVTSAQQTVNQNLNNKMAVSISRRLRRSTSLRSTIEEDYRKWNDDSACLTAGSCENAKGNKRWFCQCDADCLVFQDCCYDYELLSTTPIKPKYNYSRHLFQNERIIGYGFYSIDYCPSTFQDQVVIDKCLENSFGGNLFVVHNKTMVFRNKYCAICNNVTEFEYFDRLVTTRLLDVKNFSALTAGDEIQFMEEFSSYTHIPPHDAIVRVCIIGWVTNDDPLCNAYSRPMVGGTKGSRVPQVFKNTHCILSNETEIKTVCLHNRLLMNLGDDDKMFLMSMMFSFKEKDPREECVIWTEEMEKSRRCQGHNLVTNAGEDLMLYMVSDTNLTDDELYQIGALVPWLCTTNVTHVLWLDVSLCGFNYVVVSKLSLIYNKTSFVHEYLNLINHLKTRDIVVKIDSPKIDSVVTLQVFHDKNITFMCGNKTRRFYPNFLFKFIVDANKHEINVNSEIIEVHTTIQNKSLVVKKVIQRMRTAETTDPSFISDIVTYSCFVLSIVSLLVLICFQRMFDLVDNIPSSNIENISVSLLLSSVLFVLGTLDLMKGTLWCYIIGIAQHYLWLSVFAFMSVSVVWINVTLTRIKSRKQVRDDGYCRKRALLTLLGLMVPILFVGPCVYLDVNGPTYLSSAYDQDCFPNRYPSNLAFFSGPIILAVSINFFSLSYIIFKICVIRIEASHIRKLNPYKEATIYLRMATMSGVLWTTGIMASIFDVVWLNYLFTVLCGLQGFFLSVANLTSRRVNCMSRIRDTTSFSSNRT